MAVDIDLPVDQPDPVAGNAHHALHKMLGGMNGITKNNHVSPLHLTVGHEEVPEETASTVAQFVHQQIVADQQRVFHGFRGNLERLHDEGDHKDGDDYGREQRLQRTQGVRRRTLLLYFGSGGLTVTGSARCAWSCRSAPGSRCQDIPAPGGRRPVRHFSWWNRPPGPQIPLCRLVQRLQARLDGKSLAMLRAALFHQGVRGLGPSRWPAVSPATPICNR